MSKLKTEYRVGVGASSVLMVLVVLSMAALGLLALGSARSTQTLTARNVQATTTYYTAASEVQRTLSTIDEAVLSYQAAQQTSPLNEWLSGRVQGVEWTQKQDGLTFTFTVDTGDSRAILAEGVVDASAPQRVTLTTHTLIDTGAPAQADPILLMGD